jgi:zinc carboxypeptidase/immune inhibitor InhA-like protein
MRRWTAILALALASVVLAAAAGSAYGKGGNPSKLEVYTITVEPAQAEELAREGFDIVATRRSGDKVEIDVVLSAREHGQLSRRFDVKVKLNRDGKSATQLAAEQAASGYTVWRSWDEPGGIRDELYAIARDNPQLVKLVVLGTTYQGREIIALKLTQGARGQRDGSRPAVLYSSLQHAREWIAVEVNRRLLHRFIDRWRANDTATKNLLKDTELWFVIVANPDGYQYTFDVERLWRKNLRDNDGDGQITNADGVDPNRNWPEHWNYDEEGSSSQISSETYRGPAPTSEPETVALKGLLDRTKFKFMVNYHSFGEWLLYPEGWQVGTPTADDPIYFALSGNKDTPAIPGFHPGLASDVLYVTNGETTDYAHSGTGALAWTPELGEGTPGSNFVFPDDEALIQAEFERNIPFALDVAKSALDPDDPVSHQGRTTKPFYLKSDDTYKFGLPLAHLSFAVSYGDPQEVRVLAKRSLGAVTLKYQINGGAVQSRPTSEWNGGERYGGQTDFYYHIMRGTVTGTQPGDSVRVWFEGGGQTSDSFTYSAVEESNDRVLIVAAEDYTGASPVQAAGPHFLSYYTAALTANGIGYDVYDVDARGRRAPDALGVLSHYDAVVWYTGNDVITRELGWGAGNLSRLGMDTLLETREYLNAGGRVLYTGKYAGHQYATGHGSQFYDPTEANAQCSLPAVAPRCFAGHGSGDMMNDVLEYWFGAYILIEDSGFNPDTDNLYDVIGVDTPFSSLSWGFNGADSAQNQDHSASFIATSGILPPSTYPQFTSWVSAKYDRPGGPFDPHTGSYYMYSQIGDVSYKRLTRTITVPAGGATMSLWTSYDTESQWDFVFVEAHTVGQDDWTTLPDLNGHTSSDTGESCPAGWHELHPHLAHYQTFVPGPPDTCTPTGTTGSWNAASGNSGGWQQWQVDLAPFAGKQVEISIAYASDWAVQGLGTFIDDIMVSTGEGTTSFETDLGGWQVSGPPPGSGPNPNDFIRTTAAGFPEGATMSTPDTLYFGFGFEGITGAPTRATVMGRAMDHLLP